MGDFDRKKYENMMEEFITDSEIRNIILDGFKGQQFDNSCTAYSFAAGVVDKLHNCSGLKGLSFNDRYVLLFIQISNFSNLVCNETFLNYICEILNVISRSIAYSVAFDKGYKTSINMLTSV